MTLPAIYFGHPPQFWQERKRVGCKPVANMNDATTMRDKVHYDSLHLQNAIINRTSEKVQQLLNQEEIKLNYRRQKLRNLLEAEQQQYFDELRSLRRREEYLDEQRRENLELEKKEELQREKARECQNALEREAIARGMQSTREDEIQLRLMQKMQVDEQKMIADEQRELENMWHQVLIEDVRRKENAEIIAKHRKYQEMIERRRTYDEQIATAQEKRNRIIREEREKENRRLARLHDNLEKERLKEQQYKKQQQYLNRLNYIEGHKEKLAQINKNWYKDREIDEHTIRKALRELTEERIHKRIEMDNLQKTEKVFTELSDKERKEAAKIKEMENKVIQRWQEQSICRTKEFLKEEKLKNRLEKEKLASDYKRYLEELDNLKKTEREERSAQMERVTRMAREELKKKFDSAQKELFDQLEYREKLNEQITGNQNVLVSEMKASEVRLKPFTRRPETFRDKMNSYVDVSLCGNSFNPVHPFRRAMESKQGLSCPIVLPSI